MEFTTNGGRIQKVNHRRVPLEKKIGGGGLYFVGMWIILVFWNETRIERYPAEISIEMGPLTSYGNLDIDIAYTFTDMDKDLAIHTNEDTFRP